MRSISESGRKALELLEAPGGKPCLKAYKDSAGIWTNGFGHIKGVNANTPDITAAEADANLLADLHWAETTVDTAVKVEVNQNQFDALVIFTFNVGVGAPKGKKDGPSGFLGSTLLEELNKGNYDAVPTQLARWNKVTDPVTKKKMVSQGLVNRRAAEIALWTKIMQPMNAAQEAVTVVAPPQDAPELASPPKPVAPAASVATTKTGATLIGTLTTGGGAAVLQGIADGKQYKDALDGVLGGVASGKQWYLVVSCVLVIAAVGFSIWTLLHKARTMRS